MSDAVDLRRPQGEPIALVFDSPHSGEEHPDDFRPAVPIQALRAGIDRYVDELFSDEFKQLVVEFDSMDDSFDELVDRNLLTNFRDTAKEIGIRERDFITALVERKYIYRTRDGKLMPYADRNDGLFEVKECFNDKTNWRGVQTLVTPKGREKFLRML